MPEGLQTGGLIVVGLGAIAIALLIHFLWQYVARGLLLRAELQKVARQVRGLNNSPRADLRTALQKLFAGKRTEHAWSEFEETLHDQFEVVGGARRLRDIRATLPAETFINLETSVDPRIGAEYFRHLPGLFTGLGIIGTFSGLIQGLIAFNPTLDAKALKSSLSELFSHVESAFVFSAFAIGVAMVVTLFEKWIYSSCAKWLGELTAALDSLFRAGVGEEYLSGLLQASQENATQTRQLKESMVDDLKVLLTNLTDRQIQATQQLSSDLSRQIEGSLKEPLSHLVETVRNASGQQTTAASQVLENLMSAFMAQMRETLGGQIGDLSGLMQQTAQSMTAVEAGMRALVGDMQKASSESTSGMQGAVRELIESLALQQRHQAEAIHGSTSGLLERIEGTVGRLAAQQTVLTQRTQASLASATQAVDERVAALAQANQQSAQATANAITAMSSVSSEAISGMNRGAAAVTEAFKVVQTAADRLAQLTDKMAGVQANLVESSQQLTQSSGTLGTATQSLATVTTALGSTTARLESVAQLARTEADARAKLLSDLNNLTERSRATGQELATLSEEVRGNLAANVESFGNSVSKVLTQHLADYQKQLSDAVSMLKNALEELAEYASDQGP